MTGLLYTLCLLVIGCHDSLGKSALRGMFPDKYPPMMQNGVDPGEPVFLTPYIEKGQFQEGKKAEEVKVCCHSFLDDF